MAIHVNNDGSRVSLGYGYLNSKGELSLGSQPGGSFIRTKKYGTPKRTARYKVGAFLQHKDTSIGVEQVKIVKQLPGGQYRVEQRLNGVVLTTMVVREHVLRQDYKKV